MEDVETEAGKATGDTETAFGEHFFLLHGHGTHGQLGCLLWRHEKQMKSVAVSRRHFKRTCVLLVLKTRSTEGSFRQHCTGDTGRQVRRRIEGCTLMCTITSTGKLSTGVRGKGSVTSDEEAAAEEFKICNSSSINDLAANISYLKI